MDIENKPFEDPGLENYTEDQPEVYAVSRKEDGIHFSRRDFIEITGVVTAGVLIASNLGVNEVAAQGATRTPTPSTDCTLRSDTDIQVHVGPGRERGIRAYLPKNQDVPVLGQAEDKQGNLWWQIQMPKIEQAWVADEDVTTRGDCEEASDVTPPPVMTATNRSTATPEPDKGVPGTVQPGQTGVNYTLRGETFTLPCGSPLPRNAVCVCNCVTVPAQCSCDSHVSCGCDGVCSCAGASHYWYPN